MDNYHIGKSGTLTGLACWLIIYLIKAKIRLKLSTLDHFTPISTLRNKLMLITWGILLLKSCPERIHLYS